MPTRERCERLALIVTRMRSAASPRGGGKRENHFSVTLSSHSIGCELTTEHKYCIKFWFYFSMILCLNKTKKLR